MLAKFTFKVPLPLQNKSIITIRSKCARSGKSKVYFHVVNNVGHTNHTVHPNIRTQTKIWLIVLITSSVKIYILIIVIIIIIIFFTNFHSANIPENNRPEWHTKYRANS